MEPVYRPVIGLAIAVMKAMRWNVSVSGAEHVPATHGAVLATNHVGYLDFVFVGFAARQRKRLVRFLAKQEVFEHTVAGPLMRGMRHIPVDRFGQAGRALDLSIEALRRGEVVGMFPEGTISRSFVPREGKTGAARMALQANVPLIPGAVWGTQRILTKGRPRSFPRNLPISVAFGPPIEYVVGDDPGVITKRLMRAIEHLVAGLQEGYPERPRDAADSWWLPAHLGGGAPTVGEADAMAERERAERAARRAAEGNA